MKVLVGAVLFTFIVGKSSAIRCWKCSSDIDPSCRDPFSEYGSNRNYRQGGQSGQSGVYDNSQQNYNQRQYDNYNTRYDNQQRYDNRDTNYQNNPAGGFNNYNAGFNSANRAPSLELCDENEARNRRMRNVCLKEIVRGSSYVSVVRRCEMVPYEQVIGTCSQSVSRGLTLDFCEYCDWDGCNSATGLKINIYLAAIISSIVLFLYH